jgi:hypothetical protein
MKAREFITEAAPPQLSYNGLLYRPGRADTFVDLIRSGKHEFTKSDGTKVVLDKNEADRVKQLLDKALSDKSKNLPIPRGGIDIKTKGKGTINSAELVKDDAIMGKRGASLQKKEKSAAGLQPSDYFGMSSVDQEKLPTISKTDVDIPTFLEAGAIRAGDLYNKIVKNPQLKKLDPALSKAIQQTANEINSGKMAAIPSGLNEAQLGAFRDYATEYLGILSLIKGGEAINFPKSEAFYQHLNSIGSTDLSDLLLYWPSSKANPLADTLALVNDAGKSIAISSKAGQTGKGAAPSLDSLTIPDELKSGKKKKTFKEVVEFMEAGQAASGFTQPFALANEILKRSPDLMPIASSVGSFNLDSLQQSLKQKTIQPEVKKYLTLVKKYENSGLNSKASPLPRLRYYVAAELIAAVNKKNALPNFKSAVLEILGYNFIQLNTKIQGNTIATTANWPAKVDGDVVLANKYGGSETGAKLSWKLE